MSNPDYPLYLIHWVDALSDIGWADKEKVMNWGSVDDFVISEVGWLIKETDKYLIITSQCSEDGDFGNRTRIPKGWVKHKKKLTIRKDRVKK